MDEEEYEKHGIGRRESDARDDVNSLRHSDWMWRLFFTDLDETWLKNINSKMNTHSPIVSVQYSAGLIA